MTLNHQKDTIQIFHSILHSSSKLTQINSTNDNKEEEKTGTPFRQESRNKFLATGG